MGSQATVLVDELPGEPCQVRRRQHTSGPVASRRPSLSPFVGFRRKIKLSCGRAAERRQQTGRGSERSDDDDDEGLPFPRTVWAQTTVYWESILASVVGLRAGGVSRAHTQRFKPKKCKLPLLQMYNGVVITDICWWLAPSF